jgi:hypothetical protein
MSDKKDMNLLFLIFLPLIAIAQDPAMKPMDLLSICMDKPIESPIIVIDSGFCEQYMQKESEHLVRDMLQNTEQGFILDPTVCFDNKDPENSPLPKIEDKWKVRFYASHSYTTYFNSDITFQSSRYNVEIKDYSWAERSSREFFNPETWKEEGHNPFQMIDEPTNTFVASIEKDGHEFFISAFHPKFLQADNQFKYMKGTIDGISVDGFQDINKPFDGYNQTPGESELVTNRNSHKQMTFELGYGHRFTLLDSKLGSLTYVPSVAGGVMVGENVTVMIKENEWWEFDGYTDAHRIQGFGGSLTNRIEFNTPKERFGVFYENKLSFYKQNHGFMDGTQKYNLGFMGNSFGMKFMIYNPKNHKKKKTDEVPSL